MKVRHVGMDVHADTVVIAYVDDGAVAPVELGTFRASAELVTKELRKLAKGADELRCCYEAGPTGFALKRVLDERDIECVVVAPSLIPTKAGDRVKTDKRDARKLAHMFRAGLLTEVHAPTPETEAIRDVSRAREAAAEDKRRSLQRLNHFLLTKGRRFSGKKDSKRFLEWAKGQGGSLAFEAERHLLGKLVEEAVHQREREEQLVKYLTEAATGWALYPVVKALLALRGVQMITAIGVVAEVGGFARFPRAPQFMAYLGLVPSEWSTGGSKNRGALTRTGNGHVRRLLVQSAWAYHRCGSSKAIRARRRESTDYARAAAEKAEGRLSGKLRKMLGRNVPKAKAIAAVARELSGFVWDIGRQAETISKGSTNA